MKDQINENKRINRITFSGYMVISIVLQVCYILEYVKGNRTIQYVAVFSCFVLIPAIMCLVAFLKNQDTKLVKYIFGIGYSALYAFVLLTTNTNTTFVYIILLFILLTPYADFKFSLIINTIAVAVNALQIVMAASKGLTPAEFTAYEIQMAVILLSGIFAILVARVSSNVNAAKLKLIDAENAKTTELLDRILVASDDITSKLSDMTARMLTLDESVNATRNSMEDVSNGSTETAEAIQDQLLKTEEIIEHIEKVKRVSKTIAEDMRQTEEAIGIGKENIISLVGQVQTSESASNTVADKMNELNENTEKMHSIIELINSVTKQTSLLSLNASIEAARAGEAGRGFAVVASEISNLAKQTSDATVSITDLIDAIGASIEDVFGAIRQLMDSNKVQNATAEQMAGNFENIELSAKNIYDLSDDLEKVIANLVSANESIVESIHSISAITEEVSARANETYAESEKDSVIVDEATQMMEALSQRAKEMKA